MDAHAMSSAGTHDTVMAAPGSSPPPAASPSPPPRQTELVEPATDIDRLVLQIRNASGPLDASAVRAHRRLGDCHLDQGNVDDALRCYRVCLDHEALSDDDERAAVRFRLALIAVRRSRHDEAEEHLATARRLAGDDPTPALQVLQAITEAWLAIQGDREPAAVKPAQRAMEIAKRSGWRAAAADAQQCLGIALSVAGRLDEAIDTLFDAYSFQHARDHRPKMLDLLSNLGVVSIMSGQVESARGYLAKAASIGEKLGNKRRLAVVLMNLGIVNTVCGNWNEADGQLRGSIRLYRRIRDRRLEIDPTIALARLCVHRRRYEEAAKLCDHVEHVAREAALDRGMVSVDLVRGEMALARGYAQNALDHFHAILDRLDTASPRNLASAYRHRAEAYLGLGRPRLAGADATAALKACRQSADHCEEGIVRRIRSEIALADGDLERAATECRRSIDILRSHDCQPQLATALRQQTRLAIAADTAITVEDGLLGIAEAERIARRLADPVDIARCALLRSRLQVRAGMLDRAVLSFDAARKVLEPSPLRDDRLALRQAAEELQHEVSRASTSGHDRYAGLARAIAARPELVDRERLVSLFSQTAASLAADHMFFARRDAAGDTAGAAGAVILACHRVTRHRAARILEWLTDHAAPVAPKMSSPVFLTRGLRDLPERLFGDTGSLAMIPAQPTGGGADYLLYVDRRGDHPEGWLARAQIEFIGAAAEALADLARGCRQDTGISVESAALGGIAHDEEAVATPADDGSDGITADAPEAPADDLGTLVCRSAAMQSVLDQVERLADSDVPVLILGETGVGKERVARFIHACGRSRRGVFVPLIAAGLGHEMLESQLFGHRRGAFTGAERDRQGLLKVADGGTFFLDEVGEMPLENQVSFLRFLETGEYRRIGDSQLSRADIRVVSATNRDLKDAARCGAFRRDLYYRLASVVIEVPPLRERIEDILPLARHFLRIYAHADGKPGLRLSPEVLQAFMAYPWPGNVRELQNEVRRVVALASGHHAAGLELLGADVAASAGRATDDVTDLSLDEEIRRLERRRIIQVLLDTDWNQSAAAAALGLKRTTLIARMKRHGLLH